jgi:NAD(P)-dependent dehydrogenase (short-subunit alcohol dehydrogenase family)
MPTILVTGASSGLGLAFLNAYGSDGKNLLITCDKDALPPAAMAMPAMVQHHTLNAASSTSISSFAAAIENIPVDLAIHCIGVRGLVNHLHTSEEGSAQAAETLAVMDEETMMETFRINTVGTFLLLRALVPNLLLAGKQPGQESATPKVVVMSSRMGSVAANVGGGAYAYRASKAALNAVLKSFSVDVPGVAWVLCHPGRVESALVRYREEGAISAEESVQGLCPLIDGWGLENSGGFYDRFGSTINW